MAYDDYEAEKNDTDFGSPQIEITPRVSAGMMRGKKRNAPKQVKSPQAPNLGSKKGRVNRRRNAARKKVLRDQRKQAIVLNTIGEERLRRQRETEDWATECVTGPTLSMPHQLGRDHLAHKKAKSVAFKLLVLAILMPLAAGIVVYLKVHHPLF